MKYRLVFTNIHTHTDMVGEASERTVLILIQDMLKDGWMLSEITPVKTY